MTIMEVKNFLLMADIIVNIEYNDLKDRFQERLNNSIIKRPNKNDEAAFYYRSDFLAIPGFAKMPKTQFKMKRKSEGIGQTIIQFKFNTPISVLLGLVILTLWIFYIFNINKLRTSGGIIIPTLGTLLFYGVPFLSYMIELYYFKNDLEHKIKSPTKTI